MTEYTSGPLLTANQRRLIDAEAGPPPQLYATLEDLKSPSKDAIRSVESTKSRIRTNRARSSNVGSAIRDFAEDLQRIERFHRLIQGSELQFQHLCQGVGPELDYLQEIINKWKSFGENLGPPEGLLSAFEPLRNGVTPFDTEADLKEWSRRNESLYWVLRHDKNSEILGLLRRIRDHEWRQQMAELSDQNIGKKTATEYAGQELAGKKELVEEHPQSGNSKAYRLTDRGRAVVATIENLIDDGRVQRYAEEHETDELEAAAAVISRYGGG